MYWTSLKNISSRFMKNALAAIVTIPFAYDLVNKIQNKEYLEKFGEIYTIVFLGSVIYVATYIYTSKLIPEIFMYHKNLKQYVDWCKKNNGVFLTTINTNPAPFGQIGDLKKKFPDYAAYIPIDRTCGIFQQDEVASAYGYMLYKILNSSKRMHRWIISFLYIISITMIFFPQVKRLISYILSLA